MFFFPETNSNYKYLLVAKDVSTNAVDAEPMSLKSANTIVEAFKIILKRKYIDKPSLIITDRGTEFKASFDEYLKKNNIGHQTAITHQQLQPIDNIINTIGKYLNLAMLSEEVKSGKVNLSAWKKYLSKIIKILNNENYTKPVIKPENIDPQINDTGEMLNIGTKVRLKLDAPVNYLDDKHLIGNLERAI